MPEFMIFRGPDRLVNAEFRPPGRVVGWSHFTTGNTPWRVCVPMDESYDISSHETAVGAYLMLRNNLSSPGAWEAYLTLVEYAAHLNLPLVNVDAPSVVGRLTSILAELKSP